MRVLHVSEALGGGIQSAITNYVAGLEDIDHAVYFRERAGQSTYAWPDRVALERYEGGMAGFLRRLRRKVIRERPDVVHLHSSYAGIARAVLPVGTHLVYSPHCYAMERQDVPAPVRWSFGAVEYVLARRPQLTVAVSPREAEISQRLNPHTPAPVVLNPAPFEPRAQEPASRAARAEVVMVGRVLPQKDPEFFARLAQACAHAPWRFVWIGDGGESARASLEAAGVEVTGWVDPARLRERVARAALYVHTAAWEGGPVSTIEAAALGVPVLARTIPSMASLGYALGGETVEELCASLRRFFQDPEYARQVASLTRDVLAASNRSAMATTLRAVYAAAASGHAAVASGYYTSAVNAASRGLPSAR